MPREELSWQQIEGLVLVSVGQAKDVHSNTLRSLKKMDLIFQYFDRGWDVTAKGSLFVNVIAKVLGYSGRPRDRLLQLLNIEEDLGPFEVVGGKRVYYKDHR